MSTKVITMILGALIGIPGVLVFYAHTNGWATIGLLLALWGNNISLTAQNGPALTNGDDK